MNRLQTLFSNNPKNLLSIYFTAGYPNLGDTLAIAKSLEEAGADFLEIGFPYSDPVADGQVIQASSKQALDNGMTLNLLFEQLADLRKQIQIPILLMGYVNVVLQYGVEKFCVKCQELGIDGCIIPDLPMYEYENLYQPLFEKYHLSNIFLVTPQTSEERIRKIDELTNSFIYLVSSASTTGNNIADDHKAEAYFNRIANMKLKNPVVIGFGISNRDTFGKACKYANGAIIGSAFVKQLKEGYSAQSIKDFIAEIKFE